MEMFLRGRLSTVLWLLIYLKEILNNQLERRQRRIEMTKRHTHASQSRMKILVDLAQCMSNVFFSYQQLLPIFVCDEVWLEASDDTCRMNLL
jgi:hypothetical protein